MRSKENSKIQPEACHHKTKNKNQKLICIVAAARRLAYLDFHFCFLYENWQKKKVKRKAKQDFKMNLRRTLDPRRHINQLQMVNTNENIMYLLIGGFRVRWASSD